MRCFIDGVMISCSDVGRRGPMNFGQPWPLPARPKRMRLEVSLAEFIDKFRSEYDEYVEEYRGDSGFYGPLVPWCELGFPPLPQLADQEPELLARLIAEFFREDAIDVLLPEPSVGEWSPYTLNSVDRAEVAAGIVAIEGVAYDAPRRDAGEPEPA